MAPWMKVWKREAWNSVRLRVEGDIAHVQVWINDSLVTDVQETTNRAEGGIVEGPIAIQVHGGSRWILVLPASSGRRTAFRVSR